jgi:hypothetical protein
MTTPLSFFEYLSEPLTKRTRILLVVLALPLLLSFWFPLWRISMEAPQYPKGLQLDIYSYTLDGGNEGRDLTEINLLNHYIGMKQIVEDELADLDWIPFAFGVGMGSSAFLLRDVSVSSSAFAVTTASSKKSS